MLNRNQTVTNHLESTPNSFADIAFYVHDDELSPNDEFKAKVDG